MPAALARLPVDVDTRGRKHPLPRPLAAGVRVLPGQRPRELDPAGTVPEIGLVLPPDHLDMPDEIGSHDGGQHRHAVAVALAGAHDDLIGGEVHVLHPEAGTLEQTQPCAVEQDGHEPRRALELSDDGTNLLTSQDDGEPLAALGADHVVKPGHLDLEDLTVEKQQGAQCLVLRRGRDVVLLGQGAEELRNLDRSHLRRVALAVKHDVPANPGHVRLLRASAAMASAQSVANAVEQTRPRSALWGGLSDGQRPGLAPLHGVANRSGRLTKPRRRRPLSFSNRL